MDHDDLGTIITADHYPSNEAKKISCSLDGRYYDEIITRLRLQAIEKYQYGTPQQQQQQQREKLEEEGEEQLQEQKSKRSKRILVVDDEPDTCMVYQIVLQDAGYECK